MLGPWKCPLTEKQSNDTLWILQIQGLNWFQRNTSSKEMTEMKRSVILSLVLVVILLFSNGFAWSLLYDFENAKQEKEWKVLDGEGKIDNGRYVIKNTTSSSGIAVIGDMTWTDCTIKCKAMLLKGSQDNMGFVWRTAANNIFYVISVRMDQRVGYCGCINGAWMNGGSPIGPQPFSTQVEKDYELELTVKGNTFKFFLDGKDMGEWKDDQLKTGMIGIRVWSAIMSVDNFEVNGPGIPSSAVDSKGKLVATWAKIKS
jgi:hypothetical protein